MPEKELVVLRARIFHETKLAYLLNDGMGEEWVPKSVVQDNGDGTFTMPLKLAKAKGFII